MKRRKLEATFDPSKSIHRLVRWLRRNGHSKPKGAAKQSAWSLAMSRQVSGDKRQVGVATALLLFLGYQIDRTTFAPHIKLAAETQELARLVRVWSARVRPLTRHVRKQNERRGGNAEMFTIHVLPGLVDEISAKTLAQKLAAVSATISSQAYWRQMHARTHTRPTNHVLNDVVLTLREGGFGWGAIAELVDDGGGGAVAQRSERLRGYEQRRKRRSA